LPKSSSTFTSITINKDITYAPGQIQWDGQYISVQTVAETPHIKSGPVVYRLNISGSSATVVSEVHFKKAPRGVAQSWVDGSSFIMPYQARNGGSGTPYIGVWQYPQGGKPTAKFKNITTRHYELTGVTLSQ
jgi:hypothetical protein